MFEGTLVAQVVEDWGLADDTDLDNNIIALSLDAETVIESDQVQHTSLKELNKKINKNNSIKGKVKGLEYSKDNYKLKIYVDNTWVTDDTTTLDTIIDGLEGSDVISQIMESYCTKSKDGFEYYNMKRSELVYQIQTAVLTSEDAFAIDTKLKNVKDSLLTGDWITAKNYLDLVVVEGVFTQEMKDEYELEINDYITNNY